MRAEKNKRNKDGQKEREKEKKYDRKETEK